MIHELRIYKFNDGKMGKWLEAFTQQIVPLYAAHGVKIAALWRDEARNQVVWMRLFRDAEHQKTGHAAVMALPEFKALGGLFQEVGVGIVEEHNLTPVYPPAFDLSLPLHELRIYRTKPGKMEQWTKIFLKDVKPLFEAAGARVPAAWRRDDADLTPTLSARGEGARNGLFYWFRQFPGLAQQAAITSVRETPAWRALRAPFDEVGVAAVETRNLAAVLPPRFD